ncbi:Orn/Lys/Arg decarboxylase, major domain, putative [Synechococcus sp. PCC 7335]|uniref:aminotransferase class I/II-fold pyridoxal phosphate-dependent enzyme n=1 Tax=Synechococcus sp. (strain ATCC 29403 / PCC 7335) TaxID=91464 RepID=UPI00017EC779|nr:aminotransferase class I/II-fold pyridoxal phosphate-dependent enzyme [Synechococcus sp. PCC 7335]EDX84568.1 Orn/Lys/Arg decarboxylase, major domain, putative [Synechococcus sp. PCC 7335]
MNDAGRLHDRLDQSTVPLVDALQHCANRENAAFYTPGHKRGQGITHRHKQLFGKTVFRADLPELPELDNLFAPEGVILQAQQLAAAAFGAEQTWFIANGSTCGVEAAILATCGPSDKLVLPRNVHSSAVSGLILSGAVPVFIQPTYSPEWDISLDISPDKIEAALAEHPDAKAVLVVSPTYQGICSNLSIIAQIAHSHRVPLIVDEAHGAHFAFHPDLPACALSAGADIAIQSTHKVLSAFTQASMLHLQGDRINRTRLSQSLQLTQSTSPSYLLLGSLDAARYQMATAGETLMSKTLGIANQARQAVQQLSKLKVLDSDDRTRLSLNVSSLGITGFDADEFLHTECDITCELPTLHTLTFIISLGNTRSDIHQLVKGLAKLSEHPHRSSAPDQIKIDFPRSHISISPLSPRQAFFAPRAPLPLKKAIGQTCAETITTYPPGIPVLLPGETITASAIDYLQATHKAGGIVTGNSDPTLATLLTITD